MKNKVRIVSNNRNPNGKNNQASAPARSNANPAAGPLNDLLCALRPKRQALSPARNTTEFTMPAGECHPACLVIYNRKTRQPVQKIPLEECEVAALLASALDCHYSPEIWVAMAIREFMADQELNTPDTADELAPPDRAVNPLCLCIYDRAAKAPASKVPLSEHEFADLLAAINIPGFKDWGLRGIVAQSVRNFMTRNERNAATATTKDNISKALTELENAKFQSNALMRLIHESEALHESDGDLNEDVRGEVNAGVDMLVCQTTARLSAAFDSVFHQLYPRRDQTQPASASAAA